MGPVSGGNETSSSVRSGAFNALVPCSLVRTLRPHTSQVAHQAAVTSSFSSVKPQEVFLLPPGQDETVFHHRVTPSVKFDRTYLNTRVERHCESDEFCPRTQLNVPDQGTNEPEPGARSGIEYTNHEATPFHKCLGTQPNFQHCLHQTYG